MFTKAYNESYTQNRHLFFNLFDKMLEYYGGANIDIGTEVDKVGSHSTQLLSCQMTSLVFHWVFPPPVILAGISTV